MEGRKWRHEIGVKDVRPIGWGKRSNRANRKSNCREEYEGVQVEVMRRSVGEGMLRRIYVCGEFLDGLFCRGKL